MHRNHSDNTALSPVEALDAAFLSLSRGIRPVALPAALLAEQPTDRRVPVDQVRARLTHPSCRPEVRAKVWSEVVARAQNEGEPWATVAAGFAVPGVRRVLSRLPRLPLLERAEVEQEVLAALVDELAQVDPGDPHLCRRLLKAADRAGHRHTYHHIKHLRTRQTADRWAALPDLPYEPSGEAEVDEYTLLWRAVRERIVTADSADLIARTRLDGARIGDVAAERGVSSRTLFRQRAAAEDRLGHALRSQALKRPHE